MSDMNQLFNFVSLNDSLSYYKIYQMQSSNTLGDGEMPVVIVPFIEQVIINDPAVIVFWSDHTKTIGKCMDKDTFDPEVGFSMAISRKYYELIGFPNPRGAFKQQLKNAKYYPSETKNKKGQPIDK